MDNELIGWVPLTQPGTDMDFTSILALGGIAPKRETGMRTFDQRVQQRMVKDEVVFVPPRDPYAALAHASQRMAEGKSVLFPNQPANLDAD